MTRRNAAPLAWSLLALSVLMAAVTLAPMAWSSSAELPGEYRSRAVDYTYRVTLLAFPFIGALIAARHPANPIGWLFLVASLLGFTGKLAGEYALRGLVADPGSLPGAAEAVWLYEWIWIWPVVLLVPLFLLFPSGRLAHRNLRWAMVPALAAGLLMSGPVAFISWEFRGRALLIDFGSRLRREVDLEVLAEDLVGVVNSTIHRSQVSLWLRGPGSSS